MLRKILSYGLIAGLIAGGSLSVITISMQGQPQSHSGLTGYIIGYLTMLIALSTVFIAIKRHRDIQGGGVISFWKALALGLGISVVAGVLYVAAWELALLITQMDFANDYASAQIAAEKAKGVTGEALDKFIAQMQQFKEQYANPLYRYAMTFAEIFPVGVLVSLISAALLRNSRFLPARQS